MSFVSPVPGDRHDPFCFFVHFDRCGAAIGGCAASASTTVGCGRSAHPGVGVITTAQGRLGVIAARDGAATNGHDERGVESRPHPGPARETNPGPATEARSFVGSFPADAGQAVLVLRGDIDAAVVDRVAEHVEDLLEICTRFLDIDATAVDSYDPALLDLLAHTQHRLGARRGMLQVRGLRPSGLAEPATAAPDVAAPAPAPDPVVVSIADAGRP